MQSLKINADFCPGIRMRKDNRRTDPAVRTGCVTLSAADWVCNGLYRSFHFTMQHCTDKVYASVQLSKIYNRVPIEEKDETRRFQGFSFLGNRKGTGLAVAARPVMFRSSALAQHSLNIEKKNLHSRLAATSYGMEAL